MASRRLAAALLAAFGAARCAAVRTPPGLKRMDEFGLRCMPFDQTNMQRYVTAIVVTSPREEDETGEGLQALKNTIGSIREVLGLRSARIVVAWDALPQNAGFDSGLEVVASNTNASYAKKMRDFEEWNRLALGGQVTMFKNKEWTHQAEMTHRLFDHLRQRGELTPVVYMTQDDSVVSGEVDVPFILNKLSCDPTVDLVRFLWSDDCSEGQGAPQWNAPCEQHPDTPFLQRAEKMSDRPHFAVTSYYLQNVYRFIPRGYRGLPERSCPPIPRAWIYGKRHHMRHDTNALHWSYNNNPGGYNGPERPGPPSEE